MPQFAAFDLVSSSTEIIGQLYRKMFKNKKDSCRPGTVNESDAPPPFLFIDNNNNNKFVEHNVIYIIHNIY